MALNAIQLDTLNWDQMVSAIRTRIAANSKGLWTLHAPVDPGVTLLELFAWQLDQRIYWMDQIPDGLVQATLRLLGEAPQPAKAAVTVLQLTYGSQKKGALPVAVAGTVMRCSEKTPPLLFTLAEDLALLPLVQDQQAVHLYVKGTDRTPDQMRGNPVALLDRGAVSGSVEIAIAVENPIAPSATPASISILLELETPANIAPEWLAVPDAGIEPPAKLNWLYQSSTQNAPVSFATAGLKDGTLGLRRSGIVRLPVPNDWQPCAAGAKPIYKVILQIENAAYTAPPRLVSISPNAAVAQHRWKRDKFAPTKTWPLLPGNVIPLANIPNGSPYKEFPPIEDTVKLRVKERGGTDGQWRDWKRMSDLSGSGPADRVFVVNRTRGEVSFGDGLTGRLPIVQNNQALGVEISYDAGGGTGGNVGANADWEAVKVDAAQPPPLTATNLVKGEGGAESETLDDAQTRAMAALRERNRAVIQDDYKNLALTTPDAAIRRAHAEFGFHPDFPCTTVPGTVSVFVVPYAPREETDGAVDEDQFVEAPQPDSPVLNAVRARLDSGRLLGTQVFVLPPKYRPVWLEVDTAADRALSSNLREKLARKLRTYLDSLVGGDDGTGWPFGYPLRPSALLRQAQMILGTDGDALRVGVRISGQDGFESCLDVAIGSHELPSLKQVQVNVQPRAVGAGGLR